MCSYLPYAVWFYIIYSESYFCKEFSFILTRDTKFWTTYSWLHVNFSVTVHSISIWLTVYLAIFRYVYLQSASLQYETGTSTSAASSVTAANNRRRRRTTLVANTIRNCFERFLISFRTYNSCLVWIILICVFCLIFCSPAYFIYFVDKQILVSKSKSSTSIASTMATTSNESSSTSSTPDYVYFLRDTQLNLSTNGFVFKLTLYTQAIFGKLLPCILLVTFSSLLIRSLVIINHNNRKLKQLKCPTPQTRLMSANRETKLLTVPMAGVAAAAPTTSAKAGVVGNNNSLAIAKKKSRNRTKEHLRTTLMLIIVCVLFLITELPQSILIFLSIVFSEKNFYSRVYMPLGDIMDTIALLNNSINFILYCIMSRAFRTTFYTLIMNAVNSIRRVVCRKQEAMRQQQQNNRFRNSLCRADSMLAKPNVCPHSAVI